MNISVQRGMLIVFFDSKKIMTIKQKMKLINIANCPNTTIVPVKKGSGIILSLPLIALLLSSTYASKTNTKKLTLQISAILENNFIHKIIISKQNLKLGTF